MGRIWYCIKQGFKNIRRNSLFSLASIATIAACLFIFGVFYCLGQNVEHIVDEAQSTVGVSVFFKEGTTEEQILDLKDKVEIREEVDRVTYISAEEAWEHYKKQNFEGQDSDLLDNLDQDNPLKNSANLEIYLNDTARQGELVSYLDSVEIVRKVNSSDLLAEGFTNLSNMVRYTFLALIIILLLVGIFLISNTIMTGITVRAEEIAVMKYIGATDAFVKAPFYIEGIIIGLIGSAIPLVILRFMYNRVIEFVMNEFTVLQRLLTFVNVNDIFSKLIPISLGIGVGIGIIGSFFTLRKHIQV
ncbi:MAG: permease-like cell division protein FtsX [Lachnospiraceae bacterium]|nr:permease-like cell division protein FtsX [Lachnospiraceae bacterium]